MIIMTQRYKYLQHFDLLFPLLPTVCPTKQAFIFHVLICYRGNFVLGYCTFFVTISTSFLRHIVHESIYFMSLLMSVLKMIIMFLNCNGLPQNRLYFKRRVSHNIKQNLSICHCGYLFVFFSDFSSQGTAIGQSAEIT